jgi:hypothetical protein
MPPSIHPDTGRPYVRIDGPVPPPPEWFMHLVTEPGKPRGYTKFRAYAVLNHQGDLSAAARARGKRAAR